MHSVSGQMLKVIRHYRLTPIIRYNAHDLFSYSTIFRPTPIERKAELGSINDFEISHFERIFENQPDMPKCVLTKPEEVKPFNVDYTGQFKGSSSLVLLPTSTEQMADAIKLCNHWRLGILPQGGNTSLVGSSTPTFDEVIMSLRHMNRIIDIDPDTGTAVCEAGVVPADLEIALLDSAYDLVLPLDLGSWDICCIGGNAATNARGIRTLQHPDFRNSIVGLEAVLPNGDVLDVVEGSHKDPVGVDLKHCFIGTEGIFGIITKVAIRCHPRPKTTEVALLIFDDYASVLEVLRMARRDLAETLSAFEYMDHGAVRVVERELNLRLPIPDSHKRSTQAEKRHAVFIEISSSASDNQMLTLMTAFTNKIRSLGSCHSIIISQTKGEIEKLWRTRKAVIDACKAAGMVFKFDLKVPARQLPELVRLFESVAADDRLFTWHNGAVRRAPDGPDNVGRIKDLIIFGQLPTGNLHLVATIDPETWEMEKNTSAELGNHGEPRCMKRLRSALCHWLQIRNSSSGGSFLPLSKDCDGKLVRWVHRLGSDECGFPGRDLQLALKRAWDPKGIMNPYKVWPFTNF